MVTSKMAGIKVVLDLNEGSQTISNCNKSATDEQLHNLGKAVASLEKEGVEAISKVVEYSLIEE